MTKKISDIYLRNLKPTDEIQKILVGDGLYLFVRPSGKKIWHLRYYSNGSRKNVVLGAYPDLPMKEAMRQADDQKERAKTEGIDLGQEKQKKRRQKAEEAQAEDRNTFRSVSEQWLNKKSLSWVDGHTKRQKERLQGHLYPAFGNRQVNSLTMSDIDSALLPLIKDGKSETAKRACDLIRNVLEHADLMEMLENASIVGKIAKYRRTIPGSPVQRHFFQEMEDEQITSLLVGLSESKLRWTKSTSVAARLAPYVFLRASELVEAEWSEIESIA